jgi:muramoyltetrapeptide carboxypeptidase
MPNLVNSILFLEDDYESAPATFDRDLQFLIHQIGFEQVKGIVIGRFQKASNMTKELLMKIMKSKKELDRIPVVADVDFGHTTPQLTLPIGGLAIIDAKDNTVKITISD